MSESAIQGSTYTGAVKKSADVDTETLNGARATRIQVLTLTLSSTSNTCYVAVREWGSPARNTK